MSTDRRTYAVLTEPRDYNRMDYGRLTDGPNAPAQGQHGGAS